MSRSSALIVGGVALLLLSACTVTGTADKWPFVTTDAPTATTRFSPSPEALTPPTTVTTTTTKAPKLLTWGERHEWTDGVSVEVAAPAACKPGKYAHPEKTARAIMITVKITNGSTETIETGSLAYGSDVQFDSQRAVRVIDVEGACKAESGTGSATVLPGKSYTLQAAYAVGPNPGELQLTMQPSFSHVKAIYVGAA